MANLKTNSITTASGTNIDVTGSLNITGDLLQNGAPIETDPFPYTGNAQINGGLEVTGSVGFAYEAPSGPAAWTAGGALINGRSSLAGAGEQTAGLAFGGYSGGYTSCTEEYNGTSWSAGGALITARSQLAGAGTQNAGLAFGGFYAFYTSGTCTEEYDGSSWSTGGALITARYAFAGAGTQNAGLAFGGGAPLFSCTEEYDGSSWSTGGALITARDGLAGAGTQNAGLAFGGSAPTVVACTEEYDGSSWSTGGALSTPRTSPAGTGEQNAALAIGGYGSGFRNCTEEYNGTSWSAGGALLTARSSLAGAGTQTSGLAFGGFSSPSLLSCTEEYTAPTTTIKSFDYSDTTGEVSATGSFNGSFSGDGSNLTGLILEPFPYTGTAQIDGSLGVSGSVGFAYEAPSGPGVWSAGGNLLNRLDGPAGAGTQNAGLAFGGRTPAIASCTAEYNGTSWSAGGSLITARAFLGGAGEQNTGLAFGGFTPAVVSCTEEYNGTSWSTGGSLNAGRDYVSGAGTQNAGLAFGDGKCTEEYDGTTWSVATPLIYSRSNGMTGTGTQTAALAFGGFISPTVTSCTEEYDGTSWTAGGALITARTQSGGAGTQNAGLAFGGNNGAPTFANVSCTEAYDGTSWATGGALISARAGLGGAGTQTAGLAFGGGAFTNTEEYTAPTTTTRTFDYSDTTGETTVSCLIETSAERYKSNIQPLGSQLSNIMNLQPVEFDWKTNKKHDIGFVADSVQEVYPNLVSKNAQGEIEGMNYSKLVSALVKLMQEQQILLEDLETKFDNYSSK